MKLKEKTLVGGCVGEENGWNTQLLYFTGSSLSRDDKLLFMISDKGGSPNIVVRDLEKGTEKTLTQNSNGTMKSYVYFDCRPGIGLSKASVCLDAERRIAYFIQDNSICRVGENGVVAKLADVPADRVTAFTHVSSDGRLLCVPMTDARALDYDPETEGSGLDRRPIYNIDGRVQQEKLSSYLCVYDTASGALVYEKKVPLCWITHVQFNPVDPEIIMYNHEWPVSDCGIRRIWIYDHRQDAIRQVRTEGSDTLGNPHGFARKRGDWVCHEMWSDDGRIVIYHGGYENGPAMVGRYELESGRYWEIALPDDYNAYGHFTMDHDMNLVCDGYFKFPEDVKVVRENSTDNGPDPHKKDGEYISKVVPDWDKGILTWIPLCKHSSDWLGQDAHPHPIYSHDGRRIFFNSRSGRYVKVYCVDVKDRLQNSI